jgi:hypothetical protein
MRRALIWVVLLVAMASPARALLLDEEPSNGSVSTASTQVNPTADAVTVAGGRLTLSPGDVDYIGINTIVAGTIVSVSTVPLNDPPNFEIPDTIAGIFSSNGTVRCIGDDSFNNDLDAFPTGFGSLCRFRVESNGKYYVGVTGFSANPFDGAHFEQGAYSVTVTVTLPEPGALLQLASGALGLALLRARRRARC